MVTKCSVIEDKNKRCDLMSYFIFYAVVLGYCYGDYRCLGTVKKNNQA